MLVAGALTAFGIHVLAMHLPFGQAILGTEPVSAVNWGFLFLSALPILLVMELHKLSWHWRYSRYGRESRHPPV